MGRRGGWTAAAGAMALTAAAAATAALATAVLTVVFARRVVTPEPIRRDDVRILSADLPRREVRLAASDETRMHGSYGLWFDHDSGHARIGGIVGDDGRAVTRRIESVDFGRLDRAGSGRMSGWLHLGPWEITEHYEDVVVGTPLGPAPAWLVRGGPSGAASDAWIIQVHGRGAKRHEGLRAVRPALAAGWTSLLISFRNDGEAPASTDRRYGLGGTEWADVVAAVRFARAHGARRIVVMGWSMGGAIALQAVLRSEAVRESLVGVILDSPAIDWVDILRFQGRAMGLPSGLGSAVAHVLGEPWSGGLTGLAAPVDVTELDPIARADEFSTPVLLMHSVDDGFVPIDGSRRFAAARPDLIDFEVFDGARHTKLANHDPERWTALVRGTLERLAAATPEAAPAAGA
ncbi:alpha-beta hydrolase superfamily lysophospholipase [Agromyces terreus]|uniref:Alpha-beta hydrolase superfamily lysophospholipase n=1 Tax=Agromyces terreus TaxID=424795 RepID=A0A9X2H3M0_9MICO|nr:alpha/beta fold hydrolase [Agromyces terreus]MCP2372125.1 alpha-beta hydrolase superfamily lysophospholipase [Agromyces terreus]